jgi:hypothetical protein
MPRTSLFLLVLLCAGCAPSLPPVLADLPAPAADGAVERGDSWAAVRAAGGGTVRVLYVPAEGFAYTDERGRLTGVTVEMMRAFLDWLLERQRVDVRAEWVEERSWTRFYGRVRDAEGGVFGLGNVTITEARRDELRFSSPYLSNVAVLITHDEVPELASLDAVPTAFAGLAALAFEGTLHERRLRALRDRYLPDAPLLMAASNAEIVERTAAGGHFAYVDAYNYWRAREAGAPLRRHPVGDDPGEEFGVIMPLDSDWGPIIDRFLGGDDGFRASPAYRRLLAEHLGEGVAAMLESGGR